MTKKKWFLLVLAGLAIFGYFRLFYKTYSNTVVAKNADYVVAVDVKRIIQTIIWNKITMPGQWKMSNPFTSGKDEISWKDMVKIPDYIFVFHIKEQPANAWYVLLKVKDEEGFKKGIAFYHFEKAADNLYISKEYDISIFKSNDQLLISNAAVKDPQYLNAVATDIFTNRSYIDKVTLAQALDAKSHVALWVQANSFLEKDAIIAANFDKQKIQLSGSLSPKKEFIFHDQAFAYYSGQLLALRMAQPSPQVYSFLTDSARIGISKALNFNFDSLMLPGNKSYQMNILGIAPRVDSAITYTYDDDFNKIEKVVVNNVLEPAMNFVVSGDSLQNVYRYWERSGLIEQTRAGKLFTAIPFVKLYADTSDAKHLVLASSDFKIGTSDKVFKSLFFLRILLTKIPDDILKYTPDKILNIVNGIESIDIELKKQGDKELLIQSTVTAKQSALPIIGK